MNDTEEIFENRIDAGRFLAAKLSDYAGVPDLLVLTLPRGGVPVGNEIARRLHAPLDVFLVHKLAVPGHEDLAFGALASGGVHFINEETTKRLGLSARNIESIMRQEEADLQRRERLYRGGRDAVEIRGRNIILVDDGLATGSTMQAAVRALRQHQPMAITVAVPVAAIDPCRDFQGTVDKVLCGHTPKPFQAVGQWYRDFSQITDRDVLEILNHNAHELKVDKLRRRPALSSPYEDGQTRRGTRPDGI